MEQSAVLEKLRELLGREIWVSDWVFIDQKKIDDFARCTGDHQWIHVDSERASGGPFGKTIAHGFLTLSLISAMSQGLPLPFDRGEVQMTVNYGLNKVRFLNPVPVDSKVRTRVVLAGAEKKGPGRILLAYGHTIEIEGRTKPACAAETLALVFLK